MSVLVTRKCPKCKHPFETLQRNYVALGPPFRSCPRCGIRVKWDHITEWDLMNRGGKRLYIARHCYQCFFFGILFAGVVLACCFVGLSKAGMAETGRNALLLSIPCLLGGSVYIILQTNWFISEIDRSRHRMLDPEYREELRQLGYSVKEPPEQKGENM